MSVHVVNTNKAELTVPTSPPAVGNFTLACRVNLDNVTRDHILMAWASGTGNGLCQLQLDTGAGKLWALVEANDNNTQFGEASGTTVVTASTWYHVCGTYDGSLMRIYVNGVQEGTFNPSAVVPRTGNWAAFQAPTSMDGSITDIVAYTKALTAAQVLNLATYRFPADRDLIQFWVPDFGIPASPNYGGVQGALTVTGSPTAGLDPPTPWGPSKAGRAFSITTLVTLTGNDVETGTMAAGASVSGADVDAATMNASTTLAGADVQTGVMNATATISGADVETANWVSGVTIVGADIETGQFGGALAAVSGNDVETAAMAGALATLLGADVQTGKMNATATLSGADIETGTMAGASAGGGGGLPTSNGRRFGSRLSPSRMRR